MFYKSHTGTCFHEEISSFIRTDGLRYCTLYLKPLSQISDEDAIEVARIFNIGHLKGATILLIKSILSALDGSTPKSETTEFVLNWLTAQDFLRSRGYALPWMGLSVEILVEWGWIKLIKPSTCL